MQLVDEHYGADASVSEVSTPDSFKVTEEDFENIEPNLEITNDGGRVWVVRYRPYEVSVTMHGSEDPLLCDAFAARADVHGFAGVVTRGTLCCMGQFADLYSIRTTVPSKRGFFVMGLVQVAVEAVLRRMDVLRVKVTTHEKFARFLCEMGYEVECIRGGAHDTYKNVSEVPPRLPNIWRKREELMGTD